MSWWQRSEEEIPAGGGPGPICWGGMGVAMLSDPTHLLGCQMDASLPGPS